MGQVKSLRTENKFKKTEIGEIPVDWEVVNLGEVTQLIMGQSPPSESYFEFVNGIPFFQGNSEFGTKFPKILKWCNSPRKLAEKGDILVSVRAPVGDINIAPVECCIGRGLAALRGTKIYNDYLYFVMNYFKDTLVKIGQGSTFEAINKKDLFMLKIPFPIISEQKKIAEILVSVDEAIDKKQEIIERTKMLKKGLMQELLTRGIGHKKFQKTEIGEIPVDWEVKALKEVLSLNYGDGLPEGKRKGDKYPVFGSNGIIGYHDSFLVKGPGIIIGRKGTVGSITWSTEDYWPIDTTYYVVPCIGEIDLKWLYYILKILKLYQLNAATGIPGLNRNVALNIKIPLPPLHEQKRIAEALTSVDEEIENEMAHKERLEGIKKGLMQVLLTGKIRAKI